MEKHITLSTSRLLATCCLLASLFMVSCDAKLSDKAKDNTSNEVKQEDTVAMEDYVIKDLNLVFSFLPNSKILYESRDSLELEHNGYPGSFIVKPIKSGDETTLADQEEINKFLFDDNDIDPMYDDLTRGDINNKTVAGWFEYKMSYEDDYITAIFIVQSKDAGGGFAGTICVGYDEAKYIFPIMRSINFNTSQIINS